MFLVTAKISGMSKKRFTVLENINFSLLTEQEKESLYRILIENNITLSKILPSQKLALYDVSKTQSAAIEKILQNTLFYHSDLQVTYVQACPGIHSCKFGISDSLSIGRKIAQLSFPHAMPHKVKISIAGCKICCTEPYVRDVGLIGSKKGWSLIFGGNGGGKPRIGDLIAKNLEEDKAVELVRRCLTVYSLNCKKRQRTARFIEQYGLDKFKTDILKKK